MSARQSFFPSGKPTSRSSDDANSTPTSPNKQSINPVPALQDASNSPRRGLGRTRNALDNNNAQAFRTNEDKNATSSPALQRPGTAMVSAGINRPLNIGSLARPKAKKPTGDPTATPSQSQNKKHRTANISQLKENDPTSRSRSPKALPTSPSRRPLSSNPPSSFLFGPSNATLLTDNQPMSPKPRQTQPADRSDTPTAHTPSVGQRYSRISTSAPGASFTASGHSLMNAFSPTASRTYREPLEPSRSEVFPMRQNSEEPTDHAQAHMCDSLSPPTPTQRRFSEERGYDYQLPVNLDSDGPGEQNGDRTLQKQDQHFLRRATKRIGQHGEETDGVSYGRDGKRTKLDVHMKETIIEQRTDISYEQHHVRSSRSATPVPAQAQAQSHRYQTSALDQAQAREYDPHPQRPHSRLQARIPEPEQPQPTPPQVTVVNEETQAFSRLLGVDLERYFCEHVEQYEAARKRWTSCSIEEWKAGATEIIEKFGGTVEFVKEHMASKLTLHATLHDKVAQHKVVLGERDAMLKNMREKLVKDSGLVLGGGGSAP